MSNDDFFKDPEEQMEKKVDENIEEHVAPVKEEVKEPVVEKKEEPVKTEAPKEEKKKTPFFKRFKKPELPKKLVQQPQKIAGPKPTKTSKLKSFWIECKRVLRVTKKPDKQEFATIVKVSALGMAIIGVIGFLISLLKELFF